jgi:hypothetical protein
MGGKQMEGDNEERRSIAQDAREEGRKPSEVAASTGSSKQPAKSDNDETHQKKLDQTREGKHNVISGNTPTARPGSRDSDTEDRESHPRL